MSLISVSAGTLIAAEEGPILWGWYALVCIGIVCFHATANICNDYFDTRYQVDQPDSPTARYRPQPILTGMFTPAQLLTEAIILTGGLTNAGELLLGPTRRAFEECVLGVKKGKTYILVSELRNGHAAVLGASSIVRTSMRESVAT